MSLEPRRVLRLPPQLANQIAAGEVVERPASVAKELVENSLDAGASEILIEAEEGGVRLLRVRDDGGGIHRDDLPLALSRHATSKIHDARDLLGITSLGFRGEALASVASVARLRLASRTRGEETGWVVGNEEDAPSPVPHPVGTTVEVRDLFYNVPARRKFLRAERTEYEHLEQVVRRLALGNFKAGFTLRHNGRTVFNLGSALDTASQERRLNLLLGRPFLEHAVALDFEAAGLRLRGWIGTRGYTRSQADVQYVYLNGRTVRDRVLAHALRQGFGEWVEEGRFAAYVLYLEMDPAQVDVNVHPTKHEVRFREARLVHDFLVSALRSALGETPQWSSPARAVGAYNIADARGAYEALAGLAVTPMAPTISEPVLLGVIAERFLLSAGDHGLVVVDGLRLVQHEARAALVQARAAGELGGRPLLIPTVVRVGAPAVTQAENHGERLRAWGIDLHPVSADSVRLLTVPDVDATLDPQRLVSALLLACAEPDEAALLDALAEAAALPKAERARAALLARARATGCLIELEPERLAQLVREGR